MPTDSEIVGPLLKKLEEDEQYHDELCRKWERGYKAYRGELERRSEAASWTNQAHPAYALQILESMVASLVDQRPRWPVRSRPRLAPVDDITEYRQAVRGLDYLLGYQQDVSGFAASRRVHRLQALITGVTVDKTYWRYESTTGKQQKIVKEPVIDPFYGEVTGYREHAVEEDVEHVLHDDPCVEVVDVRQFLWPKNAASPEKAERLTHRVYMTFDQLKRLECKTKGGAKHSGPCEGGYYHQVDKLKDSKGFARSEQDKATTDLFNTTPAEDDVKVLEIWHRKPDGKLWLSAIGNDKVLLRDQASPFDHGRYPFVVCSGMPYPFQIPGLSEIEFVDHLQQMLWSLENQQLDSIQLLNNLIILIRSDVDDPDAFEFAPGERWLVDDPEQVKSLDLNPMAAEIATAAIARLKGDMQAIPGGMPFLSNTDSGMVDNETATGASIFTNIAQRRVAAKKGHFTRADAQVGELFLELNRQLLDQARYLEIVGPDGLPGFALIDPAQWRELDLTIRVDAMDESLVRQEKRAESVALLQVLQAAFPVFAAVAQVDPTAPMLNMKAAVDAVLEAYGIDDRDRFYSFKPPPQMQPQGQQTPPGFPGGNGATAPQAVDMNSPSNAFSQSPVAALQRLGAMQGGPANSQ